LGAFTTVAGASPGGTGTIAAGITGTFEGGYVSTVFTGVLKTVPGASTRGNIGSFDYACDTSTGVCPGYVDWKSLYFDSTAGFDLAWWGWVYHGGDDGSAAN
jgi:hypothetical protein